MAAVMIGVDPHKGSHTAVAISAAEEPLGQQRVRACAAQAERLLEWARAWPERTWAVEGAGGTGHLLAQQLLSAGERVLDVQPKLGARVRLLTAGNVNKNDPNDARSVAVAALRSAAVREAGPDDHAAVLKIWSKRHRDLSSARTQVACRLHAVLCELVAGGVARHITAGRAAQVVAAITPPDAVSAARCELAAAFIEDLRRTDAQLREAKSKLAAAVQASGTTLTGLFGIGPVTAATVIGDVRQVGRFASRDRFAAWNGTAPIEVSSGQRKVHRLSRRGNRRVNHAIHMAAVTQVSHRHSRGRAYYDKKLAEGKTPKEALRALKRQVSNAIYAALLADARRAAARTAPGGPGRATGDGSVTSAAGSHPQAPALRAGHSRTRNQPTTRPATAGDPASAPLSRAAAHVRASGQAGSKTGRSPAAQRRPQGVLDPAAREPIMPGSGKGRHTRQNPEAVAEPRPDPRHGSTPS
jgi:transposase